MKRLLRSFLITAGALWLTSQIISSFIITGGTKGFVIAVFAFMLANILLVPFLKIILLPLNLLTLGIFAWLSNVLALYIITNFVSSFQIFPYYFIGANLGGFIIPTTTLSPFQVVIAASLLISIFVHFSHWLTK